MSGKLETFKLLTYFYHNHNNFCFNLKNNSFFSVYMCKQWQELKVFNDHTALATGIRFGKHSQFIASTSMDRTLKLYGI